MINYDYSTTISYAQVYYTVYTLLVAEDLMYILIIEPSCNVHSDHNIPAFSVITTKNALPYFGQYYNDLT